MQNRSEHLPRKCFKEITISPHQVFEPPAVEINQVSELVSYNGSWLRGKDLIEAGFERSRNTGKRSVKN
jgi:hypothetical protein